MTMNGLPLTATDIPISTMQNTKIFFFWRYDFDHKKLINSGHYHYQCVFQIWDQSIQCILSCHIHIFLFQKQSRQICIKFQISEFHKDRFYVEQPINEQFYTNIEQPTKEDFHSKFHLSNFKIVVGNENLKIIKIITFLIL